MYSLEKLILILQLGFNCFQSIQGRQQTCDLHSETIEVTFNIDTKKVELFDAAKYQNVTTDLSPQTYFAKECICEEGLRKDPKHYCLILNKENACSIDSQSQREGTSKCELLPHDNSG